MKYSTLSSFLRLPKKDVGARLLDQVQGLRVADGYVWGLEGVYACDYDSDCSCGTSDSECDVFYESLQPTAKRPRSGGGTNTCTKTDLLPMWCPLRPNFQQVEECLRNFPAAHVCKCVRTRRVVSVSMVKMLP